jgi:hypothetical protein
MRAVLASVVFFVALGLVAAGCAGSYGPKPPPWLEKNAKAMAKSLGDSGAKVSYVLGPFPIAVVQGDLTCSQCSRPAGVPVQTGSAAAGRYDGHTHEGTDFSIVQGGIRDAIRGVCSTHGAGCRHGKALPAKVLLEGVTFGINRTVTHYSDADSRGRTAATLASWLKAIRTRAERWPQYHWPNPGVAKTQRALNRYARRYGFFVDRLVWQTPKQLAPEIVVHTTNYVGVGGATGRMLERLTTGYEGYYFEADDERGVPFIYVARARRGPSGTVRYWARSDAVAPWVHG